MKTASALLALVALPAAFAANSSLGTAIPGGNQSAPYVITKPGYYYLSASRVMTDNTKNAIEIKAPDVTLDLSGCTVSFATLAGGSGMGISIPTAVNVEISNGSITNIPGAAINSDIKTGSGLRLIDLRVAGTRGIYSAASATLIDRCHVTDTAMFAAIRIDGTGAIVRNCQIRNVLANNGISLVAGGTVIGNVLDTVAYNGISMTTLTAGETGGLVIDNLVRRANQSGHEWSGGIEVSMVGTVVRGNNVHDCKGTGIRLEGSGAVVDNNSANYTKAGNGTGVGHGITSANASNILRNNLGVANAGDLVNGLFTDAGGNIGN